jgi:hypothetical protein
LKAIVVIIFFLIHPQLAGRTIGGTSWQAADESQEKKQYSWGANHSLKIGNMADGSK